MTHLTSDEVIDAVEGTLPSSRREHLASCPACAREVGDLSAVLREARDLDIPEPSPLFWDHFSARVRAAVQAESPPGGGWPQWIKWPVLVPLGAMAVLVIALVVAIPRPSVPPQHATVEAASSDMVVGDEAWMIVADLIGEMDWETADAAGVVVRPGMADQAALELSAPEQRELSRLLEAELEKVKS